MGGKHLRYMSAQAKLGTLTLIADNSKVQQRNIFPYQCMQLPWIKIHWHE